MVTVENPLSTTLDPRPGPPAVAGRARAWVRYAPAGVIAVAFVPILVLHGRELWGRPHYQFFPLVVPGALALVWRWCRNLGRLEPGSSALGWAAGLASWLLLVVGVACISPGLGVLAALTALLGAAYAVGGRRLLLASLPAWGLLWLAVPPPHHLDVTLIVKLQGWVSRWSSQLLDVLGVYHVMEGNVVEIGGRSLLVDQACSGIYSLLTLLIGTLFYILWVRTSPARGAALLLASVVWVLFGNVLRIVAVVGLSTRFGIDAATGWRHELLGLVMFTVMLGLVLSTDRLLSFAVAAARWAWSGSVAAVRRGSDGSARAKAKAKGSRKAEPELLPFGLRRSAAAARPAAPPTDGAAEPVTAAAEPVASAEPAAVSNPTALPDLRRTWVGSWGMALAFGALFVPELFMPGVKWKDVLLASDVYHGLFAPLGEGAMPPQVGPLRRAGFHEENRSKSSSWGEYSRVWNFAGAGLSAAVSLDYEFVDWHELTDCYLGQGWVMTSRRIATAPPPPGSGRGRAGAGPVVVAEFTHPERGGAYLVFGLYDRRGRAIDPVDVRGTLSTLGSRFQSWFRNGDAGGRDAELLCYQLQVIARSEGSLSEEGREAILGLYAQAREQVERLGLSRAAGSRGPETKGGSR